jgi:hypothetical protein
VRASPAMPRLLRPGPGSAAGTISTSGPGWREENCGSALYDALPSPPSGWLSRRRPREPEVVATSGAMSRSRRRCRNVSGDVALQRSASQCSLICRDVSFAVAKSRSVVAMSPDLSRSRDRCRDVRVAVAKSADLSRCLLRCRKVSGAVAMSLEVSQSLERRRKGGFTVAKLGALSRCLLRCRDARLRRRNGWGADAKSPSVSQCAGSCRDVPGTVAKSRKIATGLGSARRLWGRPGSAGCNLADPRARRGRASRRARLARGERR